MSTYLDLVPSPIKVGAMAPLNTEKGYAIKCYDNMNARNTTIINIGAPSITRQDGTPMNGNDLTVPQTLIYWNGLGFGWRAVSGSNTGWYIISFPLYLANGDVITRSVLLPVVSSVG